MGNNSLSRFRREGRDAFAPDTDPDDFCPYNTPMNSWKEEAWRDGWEIAEDDYKSEQAAEETERHDWDASSVLCPWYNHDDGDCKVGGSCCASNCAPYYFKTER